MLQQTRVETVLGYYDRFLTRFPDVDSLAAADVDDVLALWSGLGYYVRARRLHSAARAVVERGTFPESSETLMELPGIGAYTAAAVASIAFGEPIPVIDGNVERVVGRLIALEEDPKRQSARRELLALAQHLLVEGRAGDSNQAVMELGATLCRPRNPQCLLCPLSDRCRARESGNPESYPPKRQRRAALKLYRLSLVVRDQNRLLLIKRDDEAGWMPGMFELPSIDIDRTEASLLESNDERIVLDLNTRLERVFGGRWTIGEERSTVRHGITHHAFRIEVRSAEVRFDDEVREVDSSSQHWTELERLDELATTSMVEKSLAGLLREENDHAVR